MIDGGEAKMEERGAGVGRHINVRPRLAILLSLDDHICLKLQYPLEDVDDPSLGAHIAQVLRHRTRH